MTPRSECPQCHANISEFLSAEVQLHFCPQCRFPLLLIAGKYRLTRELASGGFGQVFLARNIHLERDAERAIKLVKPELFQRPRMLERFRREVELTASISQYNPHIVRIFDDFGEHPTLGYYYVMEYLRGQPLDEFLEQNRPRPSLSLTLHIFVQLCQAMTTAHQADIVHRDLKPSNIFVVQVHDDPYFVKVLDFGAAKPLDNDNSNGEPLTQGLLGTPAYMSPEQCLHEPVDPRSDIYAMGLILAQMLTGRHPFMQHPTRPQQGVQALIRAHKAMPAPTLQELLPEVPWPAALETCIQNALHKDPNQRFNTANEMGEALVTATQDWSHDKNLSQEGVKLPSPKTLKGYKTSIEHTAQMSVFPTKETLPGQVPTPLVLSPYATLPPLPTQTSPSSVDISNPSSHTALRISLAVLLGLLGLLWLWSSGRPPKTNKNSNKKQVVLQNRSSKLMTVKRRTPKKAPTTCETENTQACYLADPSTKGVGQCKAGKQTCMNGKWGPCVGAIQPKQELCNNKDDDCDGAVDEDFTQKGSACQIKEGRCAFRGLFRCNNKGTKLWCDTRNARPRKGRTFHRFILKPSRASFHLTVQKRSYGKLRRRYCLELRGHPLVSLSAPKYDTCSFTLRHSSKHTRTYWLYMHKRKQGELFMAKPNYCLRKTR